MFRKPFLRACFVLWLIPLGRSVLHAQTSPAKALEPLTISKIDPPNWYASLPQPLLLLHGTGLEGAHFTLSDRALHVAHTSVSANGHWVRLQLSAAPTRPETVELAVTRNGQSLRLPYHFAASRPAADGMQGFSPRDVLYLIMTDRFADGDLHNDGSDAHSEAGSANAIAERAKPRGWHGGDLKGVLQHLDYLQGLGVTAVWITPVYVNAEPEAYHGYHATDYYGVDPHLGTMADLQNLAKALHARGMKLVLDTVPNHVGPGHPWLTDEPTPAWFHGSASMHLKASSNFTALINPHAPERDRVSTLQGWFANALPDMNTDDPSVAQYLRQNAVWWVEQTGADALRIDTFPFVNRVFWHDFNAELKDLFPRLTEVGEIYDPHPEITSSFAGGNTRAGVDTGLYTPFDFPTYFAIRDVFADGKPMQELADVVAADALYPHPERLVPFVGNHDTARFAEVVTDPQARKLAFAYLLTSRGMPQIYAGDEIAQRGKGDPDNRHDFPGGFLGDSVSTDVAKSAFLASGRTADQEDSYAWVKQLLALRREHLALACGAEQVLETGLDTMAYVRTGAGSCPAAHGDAAPEQLLVLLQRGEPTPVTIDLTSTALEGCNPGAPLLGEAGVSLANNRLTLHPLSPVLVISCRSGPSSRQR